MAAGAGFFLWRLRGTGLVVSGNGLDPAKIEETGNPYQSPPSAG